MKKIFLAIILISCFLFANQIFAKPNSPNPVSVNPAPDGSHVTISWGNVAAADNYLIRRTTDDPHIGAPSWTNIDSGNITNYTDNSVSPDTSYWYSVIAVDTHDPMDQFSDPAISSKVDVPSSLGPGSAASSSSSGLFPIVQCGNTGQPPCTLCHLFDTFNRLTIFIRNIAFIVGGLLLVVSGIMFLLTGFSSKLQATAKKIATNTIVGLVIIMLSFIIISTIVVTLAPNATTMLNLKSGAFEIECELNP